MNNHSSLKETQNLFHKMCFNQEFEPTPKLLSQTVSEATAKHLLKIPKHKQTIYRRLVYNNISSMIETAFDLSFKILPEEEKEQLIRSFLSQQKPTSNYFRDIPKDFFEFISKHQFDFEQFRKYSPLSELMDYEFTNYYLAFYNNDHQAKEIKGDGELGNSKVLLNPTCIIKSYQHPVHTIKNSIDFEFLSKIHTDLVLYRDPVNFTRDVLILNQLTKEFLIQLRDMNDKTLSEHIGLFTDQHHDHDTEKLTQAILGLIQILIDKHIILGFV